MNSITVRNHIYTLVNGPRTSLISKDEEAQLRQFASKLDREVVDKSLEMLNGANEEVKPKVTSNKDKAMAEARATVKEDKAEAAAKSVAAAKETATKKGVFRRVDQ